MACLMITSLSAQDLKKIEGKNGKFGYRDINGKEVIAPIYQNAFDFKDGLGLVVLNDKWGYIDSTGKKIIPLRYDELHYFSEGLAVANIGATKGELGYAFGGKYGFIDKSGKEIIPLKYDKVSSFNGGLAAVNIGATRGDYGMKGGKWGFIDKTGKEVIPFIYDNTGGFSEGLAFVYLNDKAGFIDPAGKEIIPLQYDRAARFDGGVAFVKLNGKCGYINKQGEAVIPLIYDDADVRFQHGLAYVSQNKMYGFIDRSGKEIVPMKYESAHSFMEGLASVKIGGKWGFIDTTGKMVIPAKYDYASLFVDGKAEVKLNGKQFYIHKNDKSIYEEDKPIVSNKSTNNDKTEAWPKTITVNSSSGIPDGDVLTMIMMEVLNKNKENIFQHSGFLGISSFTLSEKESDGKRKNDNTGKEEECVCYKSKENVLDGPLPLFVYLFKNGDIEVWFYINSPDKHTELYNHFKEKAHLLYQDKTVDFFGLGSNNSMAVISILNGKRLDGTQGSLDGGACSIYNYVKK